MGRDGREQDWSRDRQLGVDSVVWLSSPPIITRDLCAQPPHLLMASFVCVSVEGML